MKSIDQHSFLTIEIIIFNHKSDDTQSTYIHICIYIESIKNSLQSSFGKLWDIL